MSQNYDSIQYNYCSSEVGMINKFSGWLYRVSTGKRTLLFLLIFILFSILILPKQSADAASYGGDVGSPDLSFYYSPEDLNKMAEAYGEEGRDAYIKARFTFDFFWPIVYTLSLTSALSLLFLRTIPTYSGLRKLNLIPILAMLFDYLENISTSFVMWRYPEKITGIAAVAPVFTLLKWVFISMAFILLILGVVSAVRHRITLKRWVGWFWQPCSLVISFLFFWTHPELA